MDDDESKVKCIGGYGPFAIMQEVRGHIDEIHVLVVGMIMKDGTTKVGSSVGSDMELSFVKDAISESINRQVWQSAKVKTDA